MSLDYDDTPPKTDSLVLYSDEEAVRVIDVCSRVQLPGY